MRLHCLLSLLPLLLFSLSSPAHGSRLNGIGVNYGTLGDNLPSPAKSVRLIRALNAGYVKIYDANATILSALAGTGLRVSIMVRNEIIPDIAANQSAAEAWVSTNVLPFRRNTRILYLLVGNEILSDYSIQNSTWQAVVPAMQNLHRALKSHSIRNIKLGTTILTDALSVSAPPSSGTFRPDIAEPVLRPLLTFLRKTNSYFFVDAYPYFVWSANYTAISLDYALFRAGPSLYRTDPVSKLVYTNLLDEMLDSVIAAMGKLGFNDVKLAVAETGWPNGGDVDQIGGNVYNAATYNRNLARRMAGKPGTPARPRVNMPVFVFSLYNENKKPGPGTERHWGMYYPNSKPIYQVDLSGRRPMESYPPLPLANNNSPYKGPIWCVYAGGKNANVTELSGALQYACGQGNGTCNAIQSSGKCYRPNSLAVHASWAFNLYWQQFRKSGGTCYFNGFAAQTAKDPSYGSCRFPSSLN
ncbi:putative glucan endo-1,3-beta-glucosidase A6 isoform X2 [Carex rostrata]